MKYLRWFCLLIAFTFSVSSIWTFALSSDIELSVSPDFANTELNIKWAKLIEVYLVKYNQQLKEFKDLHEIASDAIIDEATEKIKQMIFSLRKIQTDKVEKWTAEKVMSKTISEIKGLNTSLKIYLKNKSAQIKEEARMSQENLLKVVWPFQRKLEKVIVNLHESVSLRAKESQDRKRLISYLSDLESENIKLKTFKKLSFKNKKEVKDYIIWSITNIQRLINWIKSSL